MAALVSLLPDVRPKLKFHRARRRCRGMTLLEVFIAITIVVVMAAVLSGMIAQMNQAWISGRQRAETFQNGRAILELMSRELAPAAISRDLQFVQNPVFSGATNLNALLPAVSGTGTTTETVNSDSLFWQRPGTANAIGNIYETGYLLTTVTPTTGAKKYQLVRFNIGPDNIATAETAPASSKTSAHATSTLYSSGSFYWIYDPPSVYDPVFVATTPWPEYSDAPWLTLLPSLQPYSTTSGTLPAAPATYAVVSDGVLAFWIRCLDKNGDPIPWLTQSSLYSSSVPSIKFNSAASFNPAILGQSIATTGSSSFTYTAPPVYETLSISSQNALIKVPPSGTFPANRLPTAVELTIVTVDSRTLTRNPTIPAVPASTGATDVPNEIQKYMNTLYAANIKTARVFSTTVRLINGTD